jgi:hypothetical protein
LIKIFIGLFRIVVSYAKTTRVGVTKSVWNVRKS